MRNELLCNLTEPNSMFTIGRTYPVIDESDRQWGVTDNLGHVRVIGKDDKRFCVKNDGPFPRYAHFRHVEDTSDLEEEHVEIIKHTFLRAAGGRYCGGSREMEKLVTAGLMVCVGKASFCPDEYYQLTRAGTYLASSLCSGKEVIDAIPSD